MSPVTCSQSQVIRVVGDSLDDKLPVPTFVDNSVVQGRFTFDKCEDVHVGPKYEHSGDIVINQTISVSGDASAAPDILAGGCRHLVFKDNPHLGKSADHSPLWILRHKAFSVIAATLALLSCALLVLFIISKHQQSNDDLSGKEGGDNFRLATSKQFDKEDYPVSLKFVSRDTWGAEPTLYLTINNTLPVERVIFIHTVTGTCHKLVTCRRKVKNIQEFHMEQPEPDLGDIGYNFVVGGDGFVYVGRGWDEVGAHTQGFNTGSLGFAFIGDFRSDEPDDKMLNAAKAVLEFGVKIGKISEDYQIFGHCQIHAGFPLSPGKNLLKHITTWSHWNSTNLEQCTG